ncbi:hypothetical protein ACWDA9_30765, partial [Streptomyces sp. NPDC001193]
MSFEFCQRVAEGGPVVEVPASHCVYVSRPAAVAGLIGRAGGRRVASGAGAPGAGARAERGGGGVGV